MFSVEFIRLLKTHAEKAASDTVPKRRSASFVDDATQFCDCTCHANLRTVVANEQISAARNQHAVSPPAIVRRDAGIIRQLPSRPPGPLKD
jgi:hypothetical protein